MLPSSTPSSRPVSKGSYSRMTTMNSSNDAKRRRTSEDFLTFCTMILDYENYEEKVIRPQETKRHSPLGSTGSNDSLPSKDEKEREDDNDDDDENDHRGNDDDDDDHDDHDVDDGGGGRGRGVGDNDDDNQVTCYCNKPFAGRPMIECSTCLTWIHLSCAKIKRTHIPDTWNCSRCTDKTARKRKT